MECHVRSVDPRPANRHRTFAGGNGECVWTVRLRIRTQYSNQCPTIGTIPEIVLTAKLAVGV
jgi:hypothetical protein